MSIRQGNGKRNGPILLYMIGEVGEREPIRPRYLNQIYVSYILRW